MKSSQELTNCFFHDLKAFNSTNFKAIAKADLSKQDAVVHKAFSSVVTRYFIFKERHPEISEQEHRILYFKLKIDMIGNYFADYPDTTTDNLVAFQLELKKYIKESKGEIDDIDAPEVQHIGMGSADAVPVEQ